MTVAIKGALAAFAPSEWGRGPLRRQARLVNGGTPSANEENWGGEVPFVTPPDLRDAVGSVVSYTSRTLTELGAATGSALVERGVALSTRAPIGYVGRIETRSAFNQGCKVLSGVSGDERFLAYFLIAAAPLLQALGQGTTFMELSNASLLDMVIATPSRDEQRAIADFLDRETGKIDALIEKQTELITRLRERQAELRADVVLGRHRQDRVETDYWFGAIPSRWSTPRLSHHHTVVLGRMINAATSRDDDVRLPYVAAGSIQPDQLVLDDAKNLSVPSSEVRKYSLRAGDVLVVEGGAGYGRSAVLDADLEGWVFQNHVARVRSRSANTDPRYVREVLEVCRLSGFFEANNRTATLPSLSRDVLGSLRIPMPPTSEQHAIAEFLGREMAKIDELVRKTERMIELSRERRSALITAAVTGQIDVNEHGGAA